MGVKIKNLPALSGLPEDGDYFAVTDESVTSKVNYTQLADAIINAYIAQSLAQPVSNAIGYLQEQATALSQRVYALETNPVIQYQTTYYSMFVNYSSGSNPHFVKYGRVVMLYGTAKPESTISSGNDLYPMFPIPDGYNPIGRVIVLQQGSGGHEWLLTIQNGVANYSRLRSGDTLIDAGTSEWLTFNVTYICDEE